MSKRSLKMAAGATVLALALMVPSAFASVPVDGGLGGNFGSLVLEKNCSDGLGILDTSQCSFNVADPTGEQEVEQKAFNTNLAVPILGMEQVQINEQEAEAKVENDADQGFQIPVAVAVAVSGESKAYGHEADVHVFAPQYADAGVYGKMEVESETGDADITGSGNGETTAIGGNTGNFQEAKAEIEGGYAKAESEDAKSEGGDGGDAEDANGGSNLLSGNGGWAIDATLGAPESEGGNGGDGGNVGATPDGLWATDSENDEDSVIPSNTTGDGGNGGAAGAAGVTGAAATAGSGGSTAGDGGYNYAGDGGAGGTAANISLAKNVGDNANAQAWNNATSGDSTMGNTYGNMIEGGTTGCNETKGVMVGGSAANVLGVAVNQSGNVTSTSGTANQNGSPSASSSNSISQSGSPNVNLNNNPNQQGWNNGGVTQTSTSSQSSSPGQTVTTGTQTASGGATGSDISVTLGEENDK